MIKKVPSTPCMFRCLFVLIVTIATGIILKNYGPFSIEESILLWFRTNQDVSLLAGPSWMYPLWKSISHSGNTLPRIMTAITAIIVFLVFRRWKTALFISVVLSGGYLFSALLKWWIARPRPAVVPHLDHVSTASFPSGHALNSTLFYFTMAVVMAPLLSGKNYRRLLYIIATIFSLMTGISRIALGVHWPTDVIGGWLIAISWLCLMMFQRPFRFLTSV